MRCWKLRGLGQTANSVDGGSAESREGEKETEGEKDG